MAYQWLYKTSLLEGSKVIYHTLTSRQSINKLELGAKYIWTTCLIHTNDNVPLNKWNCERAKLTSWYQIS